jgi:hypothetical protein
MKCAAEAKIKQRIARRENRTREVWVGGCRRRRDYHVDAA